MENQIITHSESMPKKSNGWKIFSIILLVVLLVLASYYGLTILVKGNYKQGYDDGVITIISSITSTGNIPYLDNSTGTYVIKEISISELCGRVSG